MEDIGLQKTPQYDLYKDETQSKHSFSQLAEKLEPMSEVGDHYIGVTILPPRENEIAGGHVVAQSHDTSGNVFGRTHANPILDT